MKFEKFLKGCGTHGQIVTRSNVDKWLVCGGVGMRVPRGVVNLLGSGEAPEKIVAKQTGVTLAITEADLKRNPASFSTRASFSGYF